MELLKNPNKFTFIALAVLVILIVIIVLIVRLILRRRPGRKNRQAARGYSPYRGRR